MNLSLRAGLRESTPPTDFSLDWNNYPMSTIATPTPSQVDPSVGFMDTPNVGSGSVWDQMFANVTGAGIQGLFSTFLPSAADKAATAQATANAKAADTANQIALLDAQTKAQILQLQAQVAAANRSGVVTPTSLSPILIYGGVGLLVVALVLKKRQRR